MKSQHDPRFHFAFSSGASSSAYASQISASTRAIDAGARLDNVRDKSLFRLLVEIFERFAARFLMLRQIVIGAIGDAFQFLAAERKIVFDVVSPF